MGKLTQFFWTKVAAKTLPVGEVIDAWNAGLPLDYLTAVTA